MHVSAGSLGYVGSSAASDPVPPPVPPPPHQDGARLSKGIREPKIYKDGTVRYGFLTSTGEPRNINDALADGNWRRAMQDKYDALMMNKKWHLVPLSSTKNIDMRLLVPSDGGHL